MDDQELRDAELRFRLRQAYDALWEAYKLSYKEHAEFADKIQQVKNTVEDLHNEVAEL